MIARPVSLMLLLASALPWATGWTLVGFWLLAAGGEAPSMLGVRVDLPPLVRWSAGLTALCAGQLIFLCFIADRVYPWAHQRMVAAVEVTLCLSMFLGLALTLLALFGGGVP
jgi:hypothetical protein